jgi:two-component system, OmpR family, aerobic respiration control sensor histidine kinase ArcB
MEVQKKSATEKAEGMVAQWVKHTRELVIILSLDFEIYEFNPVAQQIYGWDRKTVLGKNFLKYCGECGVESPIPADAAENLKTQTIYSENELYDGKYILSWTITHTLDSHGKPDGYMLIGQNLTQLRQLEETLRKEEASTYGTNQELIKFTLLVTGQDRREKSMIEYVKNIYSYLEGIIAAVPGYIYWMNRDAVYLGCNDNMAILHKLKSRHDIIGKTYEDIYNKESGDVYRKADTEVMTSGKPLTVAEALFNPDGTTNYYLSSKVPLRDKYGNVIGMLGNSVDITEQKRNEAALKDAKERAESANFAKSEFLAVISHEFRTPLTGILGMAKLLSMQDLTLEKQQEYVQHISNAGMHLLNLINDTLDFAKLEAGKFELAIAPIDLNSLIEETCTMLTPLSKAKNLELFFHLETSVSHQIMGDKRVLRQIIINLLGNAIKFTERGNVSIQVECLEKTSHTAKLAISFSDTGIGIPEEKQGMIFDHFSQVDASHTRRYGGAGLGLTITKLLVELMSGTISVSSQVGKGSTFRCVIEFPLQKASTLASPWMAYQSAVRILIVDETPRGQIIRKQISPSNSQVVSGKEIFNTLLASYQLNDPYDIVIVDQQLSGICPFELSKKIKEQKELKAMTVLMSENGSMSTKEMAKAAGYFECIAKPIQPLALQIALTAAWERWTEQRASL